MEKLGPFAAAHREGKVAEAARQREREPLVRAAAEASSLTDKAIAQANLAVQRMNVASPWMMDAEQKEVGRLYLEAQKALAALQNADLAAQYAEIDHLLSDALKTSGKMDIDSLKTAVVAPPKFNPGALAKATTAPVATERPPKPMLVELEAPKGIAAAFGGNKRHQRAVETARAQHEEAVKSWVNACRQIDASNELEKQKYEQAEARRLKELASAEEAYKKNCRAQSRKVAAHNKKVEQFRSDIAFDLPDALNEYMHMVVGNSVYPPSFQVDFEGSLNLETRELSIKAIVPSPSDVPTVKEYRYVTARDEIVAATLPSRSQKERYENAVWQVGLRVLRDVFEADYLEKIRTVALTVAVNRSSPATGRPETVPLVIVAADRKSVTSLQLAKVLPKAALGHLGASLSKDPFHLVAADGTGVVRVAGRS